jgi:hypothetical protein
VAVYFFNQPPIKEKVGEVAERTVNNLRNAGFNVKPIVIGDIVPFPVVCVIADLQ